MTATKNSLRRKVKVSLTRGTDKALQPKLEQAFEGKNLFQLRHYAIIDRLDRYPHRNANLWRSSSAEELAFLSQPVSTL